MRHRRSSSTDYISEIPKEILFMILYMLPIKELVAMGSLSTRWRYLCSKLVKLNFDGTPMLERMAKDRKLWTLERQKYVSQVNEFIEHHDYETIQEFRIRFDLDNEYEEHINRWLQFAVKKKVEILELDLNRIDENVGCYENYVFPKRLLDREVKHTVRWLSPNSSVVQIPFLKKLFLKNVNLTDAILREVLTNSRFLETLSIHGEVHLTYVDVGGRSIKLKHLEIVSCSNLRYIYLYEFDLEAFVYKGPTISLELEVLPKLKLLDIQTGVAWLENSLFNRMSCCLSHIQVLSFIINYPKESLKFDSIPKLPNVKNLRLTIGACRGDSLLEFTNLAKACPSLETLTIELRWESPMKRRRNLRRVASTPHHQLKTFEIVGYSGRISDFELAAHIIENAARLEKILIDTRHQSETVTTGVKNSSKKEEAARSSAMRQLKSISLGDEVDLVIL
uniref:F-box/FBD/LRR-repeat protein At1g78750-like n=1 Tax=Erigeron canadensis TaxID=72917 RepID=UPI001CB9362A|nr:F-box/FBD/LRR-repeat protein At1g78750-like [Erigeron canadensis]